MVINFLLKHLHHTPLIKTGVFLLALLFSNQLAHAQWELVANANHPRWEAPAVKVGDKMFVFAGVETGFSLSNHVEVYDVNSRVWQDLGEMPQIVTHQGFALVGTDIWMAGGRNGQFKDTDIVQIYDTQNNLWREGPALPGIRTGGGMVFLNGLLYFVSGMAVTNGFPGNCPNEDSYNNLFVYNPSKPEDGWVEKSPTLNSLNHFGIATAHNRIYMFGGQEGHDCVGIDSDQQGNGPDVNSVFEYDPVTDSWEQKADIPFNRSHIEPATFSYNGKIYVLGGEGPAVQQLIFDPIENSWEFSTDLPLGLMAAAAKVFDDVLVLAFGASGGGADLFGESETYELPLISDTENDAPRVETIPNQIKEKDDGISFQVEARDPDDGDILSFQAEGLPEGVNINSSTGEISGVVSAEPGNYRVVVTVSDNDGGSPDTKQAFTFRVLAATTLPVEFASFEVNRKENVVHLQWITSLEEGLSHFDIEKSASGKDFVTIGQLTPSGSQYEYQDEIYTYGTWYYRIKGVDIDGSETYSEIRSVQFQDINVSVYPNPGSKDFTIALEAFKDRIVKLELIDMRGRAIWTYSDVVDRGAEALHPEWNHLTPGIYSLLVESAGELLPIKVVVK